MWMVVTRVLVLLGLLVPSHQRNRPTHYENTFANGDELELRVYLSEQLRFNDFNNSAALIWHATGMRYDMSSAGDISTTVQVAVTEHMLNNGSMYCHSYFTKAGRSPDPKALGTYDRWSSTHTIMSMIAHSERLKPIGLYNLLTGEPAPWEAALRRAADEAAAAGVPEGEYIPYWKPKMHLQLVVDQVAFAIDAMPPLMHNALHQSGLMQGHRYRPFVYVNELTVMKAHWAAVNASATSLPLEISAKPLKAEHFQWMVNLKHSFAMQEEQLGISEKESEELRGMFVHTNPVLLYTTVGSPRPPPAPATLRDTGCAPMRYGRQACAILAATFDPGWEPVRSWLQASVPMCPRWLSPPSTCSSTAWHSRATSPSGRVSTPWKDCPHAQSFSTR